jgi:hypothetical protein
MSGDGNCLGGNRQLAVGKWRFPEVTVMRQFATQRPFFDQAAMFPFNADTKPVDLNHLLLLAIERALAPPVVHRRMMFQPMSVVVVDPRLLSEMNPDGQPQVELPNVLPRALPPSPDSPQFASSQFQQRIIRGEILSDANGHLYEKLGNQIGPIHQLASGQFGEVIDLVPVNTSGPRMIAAATGPKSVESPTRSESRETATGNDSEKSSFVPLQKIQEQSSETSYRKMFADPGQWRVVWWGEFKEILGQQLTHPERLKDAYRLPCYVQVLETERVVSIDELAKVYKSDNAGRARLYFLTDEIAAKLDLVLPLRPAPLPTKREPNTLLAHERVFRLVAANDPTIDVTSVKSKLQTFAPKAEVELATGTAEDSALAAASLKDHIPGRFIKEFEFKISREEALYDMHARPTIGARIRMLWNKLRVLRTRHETLKWQALLAGRTFDEQLWLVRPPADMLTDAVVRDWALKTLAVGGYDAEKMITEWEIFWRRKGF